MITQENIQFVISICTLLAIIFAIYKTFRDPDVEAKQEIALINERCKLKHKNIDDNIVLIKENHLKHIEEDIAILKQQMTRVVTIMDERMPKKD